MAGLCFHLSRIGQLGEEEKVEAGHWGVSTGLSQFEDGDVHGNIFILSGQPSQVSFVIGQRWVEVIKSNRETQVFDDGEISNNDNLAKMLSEIILDVISDNISVSRCKLKFMLIILPHINISFFPVRQSL